MGFRHVKYKFKRSDIMHILFKKTGQTLIVSLEGELDHHNAGNIREEIDRAFFGSDAKNLIFDLKKLKFMDSAGLGIIIGRYKNVLATGGKTFVSAPSGHTRRLLTLAGMNKIIPLCKNLDEALGGAAK